MWVNTKNDRNFTVGVFFRRHIETTELLRREHTRRREGGHSLYYDQNESDTIKNPSGQSAIFMDGELERSELDQVDHRLLQALCEPSNRGNSDLNGTAGMAIRPRFAKRKGFDHKVWLEPRVLRPRRMAGWTRIPGSG